jgi:hypothetical protein
VTSRGLVDDDLDDLELEVAADDGAEDTVSSTSSSSKSSTSTRKPAARKTTANGNGRTSTASVKAKAAAAGNSATNGAPKNGAAKDKADKDEEVAVKDATGEDTAVNGVSAGVPAETPAEDISGNNHVAPDASTEETAVIDAVQDDTSFSTTDFASVDETPAPAAEPSPPDMPADGIWSNNGASTTGYGNTAAKADDWAPMEASQRPSGNVYDVTDVYSAPPMPSDPYTTPVSSSAKPSFTPSARSSSSSSSSVSHEAPPRTSAGSVPPAQAFPRQAGTTSKPAPAPAPKSSASKAKAKASVRRSGGRQAHLTIARVEPWSVMKFSFAVSVVAFVIIFVAVAVLYGVLSALGVFDSLQHLVSNVTSSQNQAGYNAHTWFSASRVLSYTVLFGGINVVLITALLTIGSVIYNLTSKLIGGVEVTLRETE